ncbi:MAG: PsiF family protein [Hyphomicrobiaceae bacterium]
MSIRTMMTAAATALVLSIGSAAAQGTAPAAAPAPAKAAPKAATKAKAPAKARSAESLKCSADADAQKLKGAARKKFRAKCLKDAKKAAKPKAS